jgi:hypothetical protein
MKLGPHLQQLGPTLFYRIAGSGDIWLAQALVRQERVRRIEGNTRFARSTHMNARRGDDRQ